MPGKLLNWFVPDYLIMNTQKEGHLLLSTPIIYLGYGKFERKTQCPGIQASGNFILASSNKNSFSSIICLNFII
jgi:hypothetical protein